MLVTVIHPNFKGTGTAVERHLGVTIEGLSYIKKSEIIE